MQSYIIAHAKQSLLLLYTTSITKNALLPIWQSIITIFICQYIQHRSLLSHYEKNRIQNDTLKLQNN